MNLPAEVQAKKLAYDTFSYILDNYINKTIYQVNDHEKLIQSISIPMESFILEEGQTKEIEIPADIVKIIFTFNRFDVSGAGFEFTESIKAISGTKGFLGKVSSPWHNNTSYQIRTGTFEIDHVSELARAQNAYTGYKFVFTGPVTVNSLSLYEPHGVSMKMDTTAWDVLGGNQEILNGIKVTVDATKRLSIEGITTFENKKFKTLYANPVAGDDAYKVAEYFTKKDFNPGRQIFKFGPYLERDKKENLPLLTEDPEKPGYANYEILNAHFADGSHAISKFDELYGADLEYSICYDDWPSWYVGGKNNGRGTPAVENFDAAADLAGEYALLYEKYLKGRGPKWIEVKNESTITNEWSHHSNPISGYGWSVLADFHNKVAQAINKGNKIANVGGPTAAWMALDNNNFQEAKNHLKFIDDTAEHLDFYSYHFYESKDLILNNTKTNYGGYLTGRLEADLDLLRNHMVNTNNVKPIVISETGTLHKGPDDPDFWIKLKNHNAYMVRYMNRANEFDTVVPFLLPAMWWDKEEPDMLWAYDKNGNLYETAEEGLTKMKYFIEMWAEYNGDLLPASSSDVNDNIYAHSAQDGNVIYVAITNMNAQRAYIDLNLILEDEQIQKIERTTIYLDQGELYFVDKELLSSLNDIFMHVEETSIIKITLNKAPNIDSTLTKVTYYGDKMLQDTGAAIDFVINTPNLNVDSSILRVSLGRADGFNVALNVSINGHNFDAYDMSFTNKPDRYFGYVDFAVPTELLRAQNNISVSINQSAGKISTVALINSCL